MIFKLLRYAEYLVLKSQGKGYGAISIDREVKAALNLLEKSLSLAVDIGANIGSYAHQLLKSKPELELHLFEPSTSNYSKLISRFENNSNIFINQLAISNRNDSAILYGDFDGSPLSSLSNRNLKHFYVNFHEVERVTTTRFEDYWSSQLNKRCVDLVKMDIEGHELDALKGFGESINSIKLIQFEFGGCNIDSRTYFQDFWYFFEKENFKLFRITPLGIQPIIRYREFDENFITTNYLALNSRFD